MRNVDILGWWKRKETGGGGEGQEGVGEGGKGG